MQTLIIILMLVAIVIGLVLMMMAFTYPELLAGGARFLFVKPIKALISSMTKTKHRKEATPATKAVEAKLKPVTLR